VAAIFIVDYLAFSVPAPIAGVATATFGLHSTALVYSVSLAALTARPLAGDDGRNPAGGVRQSGARITPGNDPRTEGAGRAEVMQVPELIGGASGLGWVAVKAVLLFSVAVIGLRLGERRTLAQLSAFDFAVAVAIGAIIGRGATASDTSFATSAVALVTFLVAHRVIAIGRRHSRVVRLIDHPPRVLVARGELQDRELARAGLTAEDVYALLRENGVGDLGQVGYLLYEERGAVTVIGIGDREPGPLLQDGLNASGYRQAPGAHQ
jgi:uncharacterized membrane protein YcaP (DUF421 family)